MFLALKGVRIRSSWTCVGHRTCHALFHFFTVTTPGHSEHVFPADVLDRIAIHFLREDDYRRYYQ
jgi:hypothetical protein